MIWNLILSLIMALISFISTKKGKEENNGKALAAAAVAGLGTSYLLDNTEWGQDSIAWLNKNVANLDGAALPSADPTSADKRVVETTDADGKTIYQVTDAAGNPLKDGSGNIIQAKPVTDTSGKTTWSVIDSAGKLVTKVEAGTATPAETTTGTGLWDKISSWGSTGTAAVAGVAAGSLFSKYAPWIIGGVIALLILK